MKPVRTDKAPLPAGPYSQAVITGNLVFVSGLIPTSPSDGKIPEGTEEQIRLTLKNVVSVLEAAGVGKGKGIKVSVYL
ncbi:MAG: Rid family hydrolase, partial [Methanomassiliicoccaceae archaeon]|nr:Rid family hydrolase [Methanomassiliicoccaceae archaeon]